MIVRIAIAGLTAIGGARVLELLGAGDDETFPPPVLTISVALVAAVVAWRVLK